MKKINYIITIKVCTLPKQTDVSYFESYYEYENKEKANKDFNRIKRDAASSMIEAHLYEVKELK